MSSTRFRWVQLSLRSLRAKGRPETAVKRLRELPRELKELYDDIYEEIGRIHPSDFLLVRRTLMLIMYQRVSLRSTEIVEAVWGDSLEDPSDVMGQRIQLLSDMCSDFVELDSNTGYFRLAHSSVRDFLESKEEFAENAGHAELAKMCISAAAEWFRKANILQNYAMSWKLGHFICYALTQWPAHVWKASNLRAEDKELAVLLDVRSNWCPPSVAWRTWLSRVLCLAPSLTDDEASRFSATDKDSMVSGGSGLYGSPENMSSGSGSSASGTETAPTRSITRMWNKPQRWLPQRKPDRDFIQKAARQLLKRSTSTPPNPLFAFSAWHIPELVCGTALLPDSLNLWQMRNIVGETPVTDFCTSFSIPELERALTGDLEIIFKVLLQGHPEFISAAITRDFAPDEKTRLVELLLEHGADFNRGSTSQPNALHSAADFNLPNVLELLLAHGAEIDARDYSHATALDRACANGSLGAARLLLSRGASTKSDFLRSPPLLVAATHHQWDIFRLLVNDQVGLDTRAGRGRDLLELALRDSKDEMVVLLLQRGARICSESYGPSLLWSALTQRPPSVAIIKALLEHGAYVNEVGDLQEYPLQYAARNLNADIIGLLCLHGGDPNQRAVRGRTALQLAIIACNASGTSALIEATIDVEARDDEGYTALHLAAQHFPNEDIICLLSKHGADLSAKDDTGKTALHLATAARNVDGVRALIKLQIDVEAKDADGRTALHLASRLWSNYNLEGPNTALSLIDLLLSNGANINATDNNGDTPLFLASKIFIYPDKNPLVKCLLARGADSSITNSKGETAARLHLTQLKSILKKRTDAESQAL
jgi:ankyrin repeat protein